MYMAQLSELLVCILIQSRKCSWNCTVPLPRDVGKGWGPFACIPIEQFQRAGPRNWLQREKDSDLWNNGRGQYLWGDVTWTPSAWTCIPGQYSSGWAVKQTNNPSDSLLKAKLPSLLFSALLYHFLKQNIPTTNNSFYTEHSNSPSSFTLFHTVQFEMTLLEILYLLDTTMKAFT